MFGVLARFSLHFVTFVYDFTSINSQRFLLKFTRGGSMALVKVQLCLEQIQINEKSIVSQFGINCFFLLFCKTKEKKQRKSFEMKINIDHSIDLFDLTNR